MKLQQLKVGFMVATLAVALLVTAPADVWSQGRGGFGNRGGFPGGQEQMGPQLTETQKAELQKIVQDLRANSATREEIQAAVHAYFEVQGIEWSGNRGGNRTDRNPRLNEEQRAELKGLVQSLKESGASQEEIKNAVDSLFDQWGIEKPDFKQGRLSHRPGAHEALLELLTPDQQETIKAKLAELKAAGATREETHEAIKVLYAGFGLELPEFSHLGGKGQFGGLQLTEEQKAILKALVEGLKENGATREVREAVDGLFAEWGIERPEHSGFWRKGHGAKGHRGEFPGANLTEEQRLILRETVQALKEQGATREEIHAAVKTLLDQWNNEAPEGPTALTGNAKIKARNYPNPFNPTTRINFQIEEPGNVSVEIFNTQGQSIRTLVNEYRNQGLYEVTWDALNDVGEMVPTGMYFYKITAGSETLTQRMLLMK